MCCRIMVKECGLLILILNHLTQFLRYVCSICIQEHPLLGMHILLLSLLIVFTFSTLLVIFVCSRAWTGCIKCSHNCSVFSVKFCQLLVDLWACVVNCIHIHDGGICSQCHSCGELFDVMMILVVFKYNSRSYIWK